MTSTDLTPVEVPDIGDFADVPIIEILVSPGDAVVAEDPLLTLESDKATMDVPAPFSGVVRELHASVGDRVSQGTLLLSMEPADRAPTGTAASAAVSEGATSEAEAPDALASATEAEDASAPAAEAAPAAESAPAPKPAEGASRNGGGPTATGAPVYASPGVRRLARELGVDLTGVHGTGRKGRITKDDVQAAKEGSGRRGDSDGGAAAGGGTQAAADGLSLLPWPQIDFSRFGEIERVPRSRIQRISGPNMARNWVMIPHVTQHDEADITELEAWRKALNAEHSAEGVKVTMLAFLVLACVRALREFPQFNASLDGEELILKRYYNIGFAADTPNGLLVPVIKGADELGLLDVARELASLSARARDGKLAPGDMQGASFTISSLGGIGGTAFTPIINAPEVAILGVSRSVMRPVWDGTQFTPRLMLPLSLSYDHRVIDGAAAARFTVFLGRVLGDLRRVLL